MFCFSFKQELLVESHAADQESKAHRGIGNNEIDSGDWSVTQADTKRDHQPDHEISLPGRKCENEGARRKLADSLNVSPDDFDKQEHIKQQGESPAERFKDDFSFEREVSEPRERPDAENTSGDRPEQAGEDEEIRAGNGWKTGHAGQSRIVNGAEALRATFRPGFRAKFLYRLRWSK